MTILDPCAILVVKRLYEEPPSQNEIDRLMFPGGQVDICRGRNDYWHDTNYNDNPELEDLELCIQEIE